MKTSLLTFAFFSVTLFHSFAGGNTSIVELDKVTSIKIEAERIFIVGSGMVRKRVMSDAEHGNDSVFGQPAVWFHAKVTDCEFEVIPYHMRSDVEGVPGIDPENVTPEIKAKSMKWWAGTLAKAKEIRVGDAITIVYQREKMTITSVYVTNIVGSGSLSIRKGVKEQKGTEQKE
jgi:hypothetical protein